MLVISEALLLENQLVEYSNIWDVKWLGQIMLVTGVHSLEC